MLTSESLDCRTDLLFDVARTELLDWGQVAEVLPLVHPNGVGKLVTNRSSRAFREDPQQVAEQIRDHQAVAAVHVSLFQAAIVPEHVPAGMTTAPPCMRHLLMAVAQWPAQDHFHVRLAQIIPQGDSVDLVELADPGLTVTSWLTDLLPRP